MPKFRYLLNILAIDQTIDIVFYLNLRMLFANIFRLLSLRNHFDLFYHTFDIVFLLLFIINASGIWASLWYMTFKLETGQKKEILLWTSPFTFMRELSGWPTNFDHFDWFIGGDIIQKKAQPKLLFFQKRLDDCWTLI